MLRLVAVTALLLLAVRNRCSPLPRPASCSSAAGAGELAGAFGASAGRSTRHGTAGLAVLTLAAWPPEIPTFLHHHPFHLHGFFFQVVEVNGAPPAFLSWEDTVNVFAKGRVRIAWLPDDRPGSWMYHCHTSSITPRE